MLDRALLVRARVGCAILAAGAGTRFGRAGEKLTAPCGGKPLLQHAIDGASASSATACTLVLGAAAEMVMTRVDARRSAVYVNAAWTDGLSSSVKLAIAVHQEYDACILTLGDRPYVSAEDLDALIAVHLDNPASIVALRRGRVWGAPVLFTTGDYPALARLSGDAGAKTYAEAQRGRLKFVDAICPDAFADVDGPGDLKGQSPGRSLGIRRSRAPR